MLQSEIAKQGIAQNKSDGDADTVASLIDQSQALDKAATEVSGICDDTVVDEIDSHRYAVLEKLIATPFTCPADSQRACEYLIAVLEDSICPGEEPCLMDRVKMHLLTNLLATAISLEPTPDLPPLVRLQHLLTELHARGPRVLFEWVVKGWDQPLSTFMKRLEDFATIDRDDLKTAGGDKFPPALAALDGGLADTPSDPAA